MDSVAIPDPKKHTLTLYLAIAFLPAWVLFFIVNAFFRSNLPVLYLGHVGAMMMPALGAWTAYRYNGRTRFGAWFGRAPVSLYILILFYVLLMWATPLLLGMWLNTFHFQAPRHALVWLVIFSSLFLNIVPGFGEEFGWRGFLLPHLMRKGLWRGFFLHGVIWGVWHLPIFLTPFLVEMVRGGLGVEDWIRLGMDGFAAICGSTLMGFILGWLWLRFRSILLIAFFHAYLIGFRDVFGILFPGYATSILLSVSLYVFQVIPVIILVTTSSHFKTAKPAIRQASQ